LLLFILFRFVSDVFEIGTGCRFLIPAIVIVIVIVLPYLLSVRVSLFVHFIH